MSQAAATPIPVLFLRRSFGVSLLRKANPNHDSRTGQFASAGGGGRSSDTRRNYEARIDELFTGDKPRPQGVRVLDRSDVLGLLGVSKEPVHLVESKVEQGRFKHGLSASDWKKMPDWLETPAAVFDSDTVAGRLVFIAPELVRDAPVRLIVDPRPDGKGVNLLINAYDADRNPFQRWERDGLLRYFDRQKAAPVTGSFQPRLTGLPGDRGRSKILTEKNLAGYRREHHPLTQSDNEAASNPLAKAHISGYTRKDGVFVAAHQDKRPNTVEPGATVQKDSPPGRPESDQDAMQSSSPTLPSSGLNISVLETGVGVNDKDAPLAKAHAIPILFLRPDAALLLKATVKKIVTVPGYVKRDGTVVPPHQKAVHYNPDTLFADVAAGKGSHSQKKAQAKLAPKDWWQKLAPDDKAIAVMSLATDLQDADSASATVSMWKKTATAGKNPTPSQWTAYNALPTDKKAALLDQVKAAAGLGHLKAPALPVQPDKAEAIGAAAPADPQQPAIAPADLDAQAKLAAMESGPHYQKIALAQLKKDQAWQKMVPAQKLETAMQLYKNLQGVASTAAAVSVGKKALLAGKVPSKAQYEAILSLAPVKQNAIAQEIGQHKYITLMDKAAEKYVAGHKDEQEPAAAQPAKPQKGGAQTVGEIKALLDGYGLGYVEGGGAGLMFSVTPGIVYKQKIKSIKDIKNGLKALYGIDAEVIKHPSGNFVLGIPVGAVTPEPPKVKPAPDATGKPLSLAEIAGWKNSHSLMAAQAAVRGSAAQVSQYLKSSKLYATKKYISGLLEKMIVTGVDKPDDAPKDGDTKPGADGMLVFKDGRWHKVDEPVASLITPAAVKVKVDGPLFINQTEGHNKQWSVSVHGSAVHTEWGKIGAKQLGMTKVFASPGVAKTHAKKLIQSKLAGGYKPAGMTSHQFRAQPGMIAPVTSAPKSATPPTATESSTQPKTPKPAPKVKKVTASSVPLASIIGGQAVLSMDDWVQTGKQAGSNPGGRFKDKSGQQWYVKFPHDEQHAKAELLAAKLYMLSGAAGQDARLVTRNGKLGIASKWVDLKQVNAKAMAALPGTKEFFAVDAWLGNHDVVGLDYSNIQQGPDGNAHRVDAGGSLMFKAQGEKKPFGNAVDAIDSLRDPKYTQPHAVFGGMSEDEIVASVKKVLAIPDDHIEQVCRMYGPGSSTDRQKLAQTLIARKADLAARYPKAAEPEPPVYRIPPKPDFANWHGPGKGLSSKAAFNHQNDVIVYHIHHLAAAGDKSGLAALTYQPIDGEGHHLPGGNKSVGLHSSKHIVGYWKDAQKAMATPYVSYKATVEKALLLAKVLGDGDFAPVAALSDAIQKIGRYAVIGKVGKDHPLMTWEPKQYHSRKTGTIDEKSLYEQSHAAFDALSNTQRTAIKEYTGSGYYAMNSSIIQGKQHNKAGNAMSGLNEAAVVIPEGTVLSRKFSLGLSASGDTTSHDSEMGKLLAAGEGVVLQEFGIISTSTNPVTWSGGVHLKIICAAGVRGLYVAGKPSGAKPLGAISKNASESEVILPVGTRFMIRKIYPKGQVVSDATGTWGNSKQQVIEVVALPN